MNDEIRGTAMDINNIIKDFTGDIKKIIGDDLSQIILYGSYARGEQRENSDIDLMILTTLSDIQIAKIEPIIVNLAFEYEIEYFIDISVILKNENHFRYWLGALPFYDNIIREGVVING